MVYPLGIRGTPDITDYRTAISHFVTGVTVVTSTGPRGPAGLTANAVCSLSLDPLLMVVCIDRGSRTLEAIRHSGRLAVNVLARRQEALAAAFAGKDAESGKFEGVEHTEVDGVPVIGGVVSWLTGELRDLAPGGDHVIGVAEVISVGAPGGDPLVYFRGGYHALSVDSP